MNGNYKYANLRPSHKRILSIIKNKNLTGPELVHLELTRRCNLNCLYCYHHSALKAGGRGQGNSDLPFDKVSKIILDFSRLNVRKIVLSGEGEPFLHPEIDNVIKLAKEYGAEVHMFTNATFDKEKLKLLPLIDRLFINISSATKRTYEMVQDVHKRGFFDKVLKNIININLLRKKHGFNLKLEANFIINNLNFREVNDFIILSKKIGIDYANFSIMNQYPHNKSLILSDEDIRKFRGILNFGIRNRPGINSNIRNIYEAFNDDTFLMSGQDKAKYGGEICKVDHCYMGWLSAYIDFRGDVYICCLRQSEDDKAGNVNEECFFDIWNSPRFHEIRMRYKNENNGDWKPCTLCPYANSNIKISERLKRLENP
jgi:cyclic pyranopterin phosphate synthase